MAPRGRWGTMRIEDWSADIGVGSQGCRLSIAEAVAVSSSNNGGKEDDRSRSTTTKGWDVACSWSTDGKENEDIDDALVAATGGKVA